MIQQTLHESHLDLLPSGLCFIPLTVVCFFFIIIKEAAISSQLPLREGHMEIPLQITARDIDLTEAIKAEITEKAEKLEKFYDGIMRCRVVVESPRRHQHAGKLYSVHIYMTIPGAELVVKRELDKDLYVVIRDAFIDARRKLEGLVSERRGEVKNHEKLPHASISTLFLEKGYGFLTSQDGTEVYFHANSVINRNFDDLKVGMKVRFVIEDGIKGPQASTVTVV
jgi:ribosomal subunit interface protein